MDGEMPLSASRLPKTSGLYRLPPTLRGVARYGLLPGALAQSAHERGRVGRSQQLLEIAALAGELLLDEGLMRDNLHGIGGVQVDVTPIGQSAPPYFEGMLGGCDCRLDIAVYCAFKRVKESIAERVEIWVAGLEPVHVIVMGDEIVKTIEGLLRPARHVDLVRLTISPEPPQY